MLKNVIVRVFTVSLCLAAPVVLAAIDPSQLVRVTGDTKVNCVEYFTYQGEMYCSTKPLTSQKIDPAIKSYEKQKIIFDERLWQLVWGKKTNDVLITEYVPAGDDINHWHELVTSQFYPGLQEQATPKEFADMFIKGLDESGYKAIVTTIKDTPNRVIIEFRIEQPASQAQDEIQMITRGKDGLYILFYVIKEADMGQARRDLWIANISNSSIIH